MTKKEFFEFAKAHNSYVKDLENPEKFFWEIELKLSLGHDEIIYTDNPDKLFNKIKDNIETQLKNQKKDIFNTLLKIIINTDTSAIIQSYNLAEGRYKEVPFKRNYVLENITIDSLGRAQEHEKILNDPRAIVITNFDKLSEREQRILLKDTGSIAYSCNLKDMGFIRTQNDGMWILIDVSKDDRKKLPLTVISRCPQMCVYCG